MPTVRAGDEGCTEACLRMGLEAWVVGSGEWQKQLDDARAEQQLQEKEAAWEQGIKWLANIVEQSAQDEGLCIANPLRPRPRPRIISKTADPSVASGGPIDGTNPDGSRIQGVEEVGPVIKEDAEVDTGVGDEENLTHTVLESTKDGFAGVGPVKDWANKLASVKPLHSLLPQDSSPQVRTISGGTGNSTRIKGPRVTPASSTRPPTPISALTSESQHWNLYIDGHNQVESKEAHRHRFSTEHVATSSLWCVDLFYLDLVVLRLKLWSQCITSVISGSELDNPEFSAPQLHAWKDHGVVKTTDYYDDVLSNDDADGGSVLADARSSQPNVPSSKRAKTHRNTFRTQRLGSGVNNKYINSDLPAGSTNNNLWCRIFISTLAHCAAGNKDPWVIPEGKFKATLQEIWDAVYKDSIEHTVVSGGPVYQLAKQAVTIITAFFANDAEFNNSDQQAEFAVAMVKKNCILFSQNRGLDIKAWSGLWSAPFVLQTFAHYFNFTQGYIEVTALDTEQMSP
ncbi:hypothetical protein SCLCIDRAFT_18408 [Scleroderma citrinum Foug A]|uniref:Uncharacterized protein n=1 Tax=Scleroderma citrinum Foug A TaxID=1036808 RepID=A0A0C2ZEP6_9AGAM|nr:hypothetical protein SCLCIDRAFT_18408 [Scleroderma citrinum Foug A]